jgi:hypothetical protein
LSKLWPEAFASRCAFSKLPQPRPVDALSACNVATGTPVATEILSTLAARDATVPNTRTNAAMITLNVFIGDKTPYKISALIGPPVPCFAKNFSALAAVKLGL